MKTKLTILFFLIYNLAFAQLDYEKKHAFSVNVNYLLDQWISKSDEQSIFHITSDHVVLAMYRYKKFRIGAGGVFKKEDVPDNFSTREWKQSHRGYVLQIGIQNFNNVWDRWDFIYGADLLLQHRIFRSEMEVDPSFVFGENLVWTEITRNDIGLNGFLGVQFHITEHLTLSSEFSLRWTRSYNDTETENDTFFNNPIQSQVSTIDQSEFINLTAPLTLFLNFRF